MASKIQNPLIESSTLLEIFSDANFCWSRHYFVVDVYGASFIGQILLLVSCALLCLILTKPSEVDQSLEMLGNARIY